MTKQLQAKVLVLGTSNCLLTGGVKQALVQHFGASNVTNISLGGASGTFLALFRFIEGVDFTSYDYVFLDSIVNEQWQFREGGSLNHLKNVATVLYSCLPPGVTYIYLGFCSSPRFHRADPVEQMHRSLCNGAGLNFISFRELLVEFSLLHGYQQKDLFPLADASHFKPALIGKLISCLCTALPSLHKKSTPALVDRDMFFTQDLKPFAATRVTHTTSLRTQEYGIFTTKSCLVPEIGCLLGFDFAVLDTEAFLHVTAEGRSFSKALHFKADRPWMKIAGFYNETMTGPGSCIRIACQADANDPTERTEATSPLKEPLSGEARLASFFFSRVPVSELSKLYRVADLQVEPALADLHDKLASFMEDHLAEMMDILAIN
ncbi:hypothetical protein [Acidisoma cladoniae]|uniref:hypothetical protein n=1 Tax=Acidisoma cladoniae TaxID=3040935 RepID=UPI00254A8CD5|nr:hypothetical protein [Acidisoma sp. PAMC 29798]